MNDTITNNPFNIIIFQSQTGAIEFRGDLKNGTIWANLLQISELFEIDKSGILRHIQNIYQTNELDEFSTVAKIAIVQKEGEREVKRHVDFYNLDLILSVGYRVNSKKATKFRQWATKILRSHVESGYSINKSRIAENYTQFLNTVESIKSLLPDNQELSTLNVLDLVSAFSETWLSLDAYDREEFLPGELTKQKLDITSEMLEEMLLNFKEELMTRNEATDIFGMERSKGSISGIVGNIMQSFAGKEVYESAQEKAAHLLYFMVKNHPFVDGNKRCGAFLFIWYLKGTNLLDISKITPSALTALTILVASSDPKEKDKVIALILNLISEKPIN